MGGRGREPGDELGVVQMKFGAGFELMLVKGCPGVSGSGTEKPGSESGGELVGHCGAAVEVGGLGCGEVVDLPTS